VTGGTGGKDPESDTRIFVNVGNRLGLRGKLVRLVAAVAALVALALVASAIHLLPQLRNPFKETTTDRSQPVLLQSIVEMKRYDAAMGNFQVVVDLSSSSFLPSFLQGNETIFIGVGTDIAYVDFSTLPSTAVQVSADRLSATITLPHAKLAGAVLDVKKSYVFGQQQGLIDRLGSLFGGDPNSQQKVYVLATQKIDAVAGQSELLADAENNTRNMLTGLLHSLGFKNVTVAYSK
jgi:hypothetical protein